MDSDCKKLRIVDAKCGVGQGGMACGPVPGPVVAEAELEDENGNRFFLCLAEVMGSPVFVKTDVSTFYEQTHENDITEEYMDFLNDHVVCSGYVYEEIFETAEPEWLEAYRYLIWIVTCSFGEDEEFIKETVGKRIGEFVIPESDVEFQYNESKYEFDE